MTPLLGKLQLASLVVTLMSFGATYVWAQSTVEISTDPFDNPGSQHMTEVEPHVFSFGSTVVAAFQQGRYFGGGCTDIGFATSLDNGVSWQHGSLPGLTIFVGGDRYESVSDTAVIYNAAFGLWLIETLPVGGEAAIFVSRSADGLNWDFPITAAFGGGGAFYDKPWITCDNHESSPFFGNCYIEWDSVFEGDLILMITSTDGGESWSNPIATADVAQGLGGQPLVLPSGRVVVPYTGFGLRSFISDNGGASWNPSVQVSSLSEHEVAGGLRAPSLPSAAIDGDGTIYLAWQDCRFRPACRANDIVISTSSDGLSWSSPARVPIEDASGPGDYFIPGLGADRNTFAPNVSLALVYYYYPQANCTPATCQLIGGFVTSSDGGISWSAPTNVTSPMALAWLPDTSFPGRMVGDYLGADFTGDGVPHPIFAAAFEPMGQFFESMFSTSVDSAARRTLEAGVTGCAGSGCQTAEVAAADDAARAEETPEPSGLRIVAPSYRVNIGAVMQLRAIGSSNPGAPISWSIEEAGAGGTVSETGLYQAPIYPGVYHIVANDDLERARIELRVFTVR